MSVISSMGESSSRVSEPASHLPFSVGERAYIWCFGTYVGTGPVYWVPYISPDLVYLFKTLLFVCVVSYPYRPGGIHRSDARFTFPGGRRTFGLIIGFSLLSLPGLFIGLSNGELAAAGGRILNNVQIFMFLCACGYVIQRGAMFRVVKVSVLVLLSCSFLSLTLMFLFPGVANPLNEALLIGQTGLGGSRTGWAPSLALYLPWLYSGALVSPGVGAVFSMSIIANQVIVAGRTGMVASVLPFATWGLLSRRSKYLFGAAAVLFFAAWYGVANREALRLDVGGVSSVGALNELSNMRIEQYIVALRAITDRPLIGFGVGDLVYDGNHWYIHNVILRLTVEGGVLYGAVAGLVLAAPLWLSRRDVLRPGASFRKAAWFSVLTGCVVTFFEPGVMFGSFNQSCFWWVCFAICVSRTFQHQERALSFSYKSGRRPVNG